MTGKGTWSPFNSQNTALSAKIIPAYPLSPKVGRYDDIWASYVIYRIAGPLRCCIAALLHPVLSSSSWQITSIMS